jgi:hypothetical protein
MPHPGILAGRRLGDIPQQTSRRRRTFPPNLCDNGQLWHGGLLWLWNCFIREQNGRAVSHGNPGPHLKKSEMQAVKSPQRSRFWTIYVLIIGATLVIDGLAIWYLWSR